MKPLLALIVVAAALVVPAVASAGLATITWHRCPSRIRFLICRCTKIPSGGCPGHG